MKLLIFGLTLFLGFVWTGLVYAGAQIVEWALANTANLANLANLPKIEIPAWFTLIFGTDSSALVSAVLPMLEWMRAVLPNPETLGAWLTPVLWGVWGLGVVGILLIAVILSFIVQKIRPG